MMTAALDHTAEVSRMAAMCAQHVAAEAAHWDELQSWRTSQGEVLVAVERGPEGFKSLRTVGNIWSKQ